MTIAQPRKLLKTFITNIPMEKEFLVQNSSRKSKKNMSSKLNYCRMKLTICAAKMTISLTLLGNNQERKLLKISNSSSKLMLNSREINLLRMNTKSEKSIKGIKCNS